MSETKFSIVVPTRQRHETLYHTLKTCLYQKDFDNYEIIIADNCSSPETRKVVDELNSPKIKYVRSDIPLSMSDNWELGVSHASSEYVTVLGDDDALLPNCLVTIDSIIKEHGFKVVKYTRLSYSWPGVVENSNQLLIPLQSKQFIIDSSQVKNLLKEVGNGHLGYSILPTIYDSFIHRDLILSLKEKTGRIFNSFVPDVYSGFVFAYLNQGFIKVGTPLGISGRSSKSNSNNYRKIMRKEKDYSSGIINEFTQLAYSSSVRVHPLIPDCRKLDFISTVVTEPFLQFKTHLVCNEGEFYFNHKKLILVWIRDIMRFSKNDKESEEYFAIIIESLKEKNEIKRWFLNSLEVKLNILFYKVLFKKNSYVGSSFIYANSTNSTTKSNLIDIVNISANCLLIDMSGFDIYDIFSVTDFVNQLLPEFGVDNFQDFDKNIFSVKNRITDSIKFLLSTTNSFSLKNIYTTYKILAYGNTPYR
jgi:glycosyltransferase involved in cell wall biosynthesis